MTENRVVVASGADRLDRLIGLGLDFFASHPRISWVLSPARWLARKLATALGYLHEEGKGYDDWTVRYDTFCDGDIAVMRNHAQAFSWGPKLSIVMPVCDPPEQFLREAIDSVLAQVYENWELCIADDASRADHVRRLLETAARSDERIKVVYRPQRGGISAASNAAAAVATGEYLGFLDHDDMLRPHTLLMVADELNHHPGALLVYSDEDKVDATGTRSEHYFKPDWNPALLRSQNYICHFTVLERRRFEDVGGFRSAYDGAQDWDLVLRATESVAADRVRHIPHVLYHWRRSATSTAQDPAAKPVAVESGRRAVEDALRRARISGTVTTLGPYQRVRYTVPAPRPRVDAVIASTGKPELLGPCLEGLLRQTDYDALQVTVAINRSALEMPDRRRLLEEQSDSRLRVFVYEDRTFSYAWVNNQAVADLDAPVLLLLNDDVRVIHPDWLEALVGHVTQDGVAAAGAMLYYPDDTIQHAGVTLGIGGVAGHRHHLLRRGRPGYGSRAWCDQDLACVTAACMLVRREVFNALGGFDERFGVAFNDVDFCLRVIDAGWRIVWTPSAELYHHESASVGPHDRPARAADFAREYSMMRQRWGKRLQRDPHYNPNLSLWIADALAFPPRVDYPWCGARSTGRAGGARQVG